MIQKSAAVCVLVMMAALWAGVVRADVLGYWRFESATAISDHPYYWEWPDSSGRGHTARSTDECSGSASVFGPTIPASGENNVGSMGFPRWYSRSDWAIVPEHSDFDFGADESFTVEMWVNFTTYSDSHDHEILQEGYYWNTPGWGFNYASSNHGIIFYLVDSTGIYLDAHSDGAINDGLWHHVAGVREVLPLGGEVVRLYIDGVLQTLDPTTAEAAARDLGNTEDLWIGGADQPYCYGGYLDELRISSGALAPSQFLNAEAPARSVPAPVLSSRGTVAALAALLGVAALGLIRRRSAASGPKRT